MIDWYEKSMRALQLAGKGERTQDAYTRSVRKLVEFFNKTPDQISETEMQDCFKSGQRYSGSGTRALRPTAKKHQKHDRSQPRQHRRST